MNRSPQGPLSDTAAAVVRTILDVFSNAFGPRLVLVSESVMTGPGPSGSNEVPTLLRMDSDPDDTGDPPMGSAAEKLNTTPAGELEDRTLVDLVLDGDQAAYKVLVERYQTRVFAVAYGVLHNREDAREVAQETFIKAYRNLPGFRRDSSFYTWIYRITVNLGIDFQRRAYRKRETELDEARITPENAHHTGPRPMATPAKNLERKQLAQQIRAAIDMLPSDQRTAIVLREIEGLSYKEIADTMGCAEGTVMSRLFYGRKKLQQILKDLR
jgi:RNA polymerase sigma-70 factor, ECF subfamily